jgi:steroid 5-alpha reductase family enzyme
MIEDIWPLMKTGWITLTCLMVCLWGWSLKRRNAGIADVGWAGGLGLLGIIYALAGDGFGPRRALIGMMVILWSARLTWHLITDRVWNQPEDPRYAALREKWGRFVGLKFFLYFQFQAALAVLLSYPFVVLATDPYPELTGYEYAGLLLWIIAWCGEALADGQLKRFKSDPANQGRTCQEGLWYHSRHPNYFFEWLIWVAYFIASLAAPFGWISIMCPVMLYLLFKFIAIPSTETQALRTRGDDYREYQKSTSVFVPWLKKSGDDGA